MDQIAATSAPLTVGLEISPLVRNAPTFTTLEVRAPSGGTEGTYYTATVVISDSLGIFSYQPVTATAVGTVTHFANLLPSKTAPEVIGAGQQMTYSIGVFNSGLTTDTPPFPLLKDALPQGVTPVSISDGGAFLDVGGATVASWTLPAMSTGDRLVRSFVVQVDPGLVTGTLIVNDNYNTTWNDIATITNTQAMTNTGEPVTTVVREVGLIDSYKTVTPTWSLPGPANVLTFVLHIANSSPVAALWRSGSRPASLGGKHLPARCGRHKRHRGQRYREP